MPTSHPIVLITAGYIAVISMIILTTWLLGPMVASVVALVAGCFVLQWPPFLQAIRDIDRSRRLEIVRRDFVANVSHELKTPVTAIRGLVETIIDDPDMPETTKYRFLGKIKGQCSRLSTLVTDLLALSRLESQDQTSCNEKIDLRDSIHESVHALTLSGEEKLITLRTDIPKNAVQICGDEEALRQAIDNLLDNAVKYTPAGGNIWVRLLTNQSQAIIEVKDTGIGIDRQAQPRIFERFFRVDRARSRALGGTGLGLSIVKHVALSHNGSVDVESVLGKGSTFRISLPLSA